MNTTAPAIDLEKLTVSQILSAVTIDQAIKIGTALTVMITAVFWSGYAYAEVVHREEKVREEAKAQAKAEAFQALAEMWEATNAKKVAAVYPKVPLPSVISKSVSFEEADIKYMRARRKFQRAIQTQQTLEPGDIQIIKNKNGEEVLKDKDCEITLPNEPAAPTYSAPATDSGSYPEAAPLPSDEPINESAQQTSTYELKYVVPILVPILFMLISWTPLIKARKQNK